ncbi:MAG: peptidylprolyl isomerase, partial [Clostridia bacterium]|nr:peptidylprolyl isomerase [Clostridia bacterium]
LYNQITQMSYQYENMYSSYGSGYGVYFTGFDMSKDPAEQDYPPSDDVPESVETWADYFRVMASTRAFLMDEMYKKATSEEAKKAGFEISDERMTEINTEIDEAIKSLEESAKEASFALDNYIARACGEGLTEKSYRALVEKDAIAQEYLTWYQEHTTDSYTKEEIAKYFNENKADFVTASARIFDVSYAEPEEGSTDAAYTKAEAEKRANEFKSKITTEESFISLAKTYAPDSLKETYENDASTLMKDVYAAEVSSNEAVTNWLFSEDRNIADTAVIEDEKAQCFYVIYIVSPASRDENVASTSVRHILIQAETTDEKGNSLGKDVIEKNFADAKAEAEKLMQTWKDNGATEEAFIALIADNTDDTASIETDGLYDDVKAGGNYVAEFTNWAIDPARKPGDADLVKTEFGYHFMYFVEASGDRAWESDVRSTMASADYDALINDIYEDVEEKSQTNETFLEFFANRLQKTISSRY